MTTEMRINAAFANKTTQDVFIDINLLLSFLSYPAFLNRCNKQGRVVQSPIKLTQD